MGTTPYSITLINIYDIGAQFEYNEEALIDDRLYGIRRTPDHAWEAVYMPGTPQERHLAESSVREVLYGVIMNEVNAQRWQRRLAKNIEQKVRRHSTVVPAAESIVNGIISLLADLSVIGVNMKQATKLATVIANHEIGVTVGMELEARNPTPQGGYVSASGIVQSVLSKGEEHHCSICGRSSRDTFMKEIPGGLWQCVDHHNGDGE